MKEWLHFGNHTNLIPCVLSADEMIVIYRTIERESLLDNEKDEENDTVVKSKVDYKHW